MKNSFKLLCSILALVVIGLSGTGLYAQEAVVADDVINIDFGGTFAASGGWNTLNNPYGTYTNLITSTDKITTVSIAFPVRVNGTNSNGTTAPTGDAAIFPSFTTSDSFFGNDVDWSGRTDPKGQLVLANLDPDLQYELTFFASRMGVSDNRQGQYAITGGGGLIETLYLNATANTDKIVTSQLILPTVDGTIVIDFQKGPENNNSYGFFYLGLVSIKAVKEIHLASSPSPANGATLVPIDSQFSWVAPTGVTNPRYNLYWWSSSDPNTVKEKLDFAETSADPGNLINGTEYNWRVDVIDPNNGAPITWKGFKWSFTTIPATPFVVDQPEDQRVFPGDMATYSISLEDSSETSYQWLKVDPNYPTGKPLVNDGRITGAQSDTLMIANAGLTDEGDYFCRATNGAGPTDSNTAILVINRLLSHWPLDGTLTDIVGGKDGTMTDKEPDFAEGVIADALSLSGEENDWVTAGMVDITGNVPRTIAGWAYGTSDLMATWTGVFGLSNTAGISGTFFDIQRIGNSGNGYGIHQHNWERPITDSYPVGEWVFLAASHDGTTTRWYGNGTLIGEAARTLDTYGLWTMGKRGDNANQFIGLIDDVRLYNYALAPTEVAKLWTDIMGGYVCVGGTPMYDLNEDCIVDINDLALFASQWMACNRYPQCIE